MWISLKERVPDFDVFVLVTCGKEAEVARRDHTDSAGEHFIIAHSQEEFHDVTHWMPLPELPELPELPK